MAAEIGDVERVDECTLDMGSSQHGTIHGRPASQPASQLTISPRGARLASRRPSVRTPPPWWAGARVLCRYCALATYPGRYVWSMYSAHVQRRPSVCSCSLAGTLMPSQKISEAA